MHAFLDETKERGLLVAVAVVHPRSLGPARKALRELLPPGQGRLHFIKERVQRRRAIASAICGLDADVDIYDARGVADHRRARAAVLDLVISPYSAKPGSPTVRRAAGLTSRS